MNAITFANSFKNFVIFVIQGTFFCSFLLTIKNVFVTLLRKSSKKKRVTAASDNIAAKYGRYLQITSAI